MKTFSVVRMADAWTVTAAGRKWGRFAFRVDAEEAAIRLAGRVITDGDDVEILIQEPWGEIRALEVA